MKAGEAVNIVTLSVSQAPPAHPHPLGLGPAKPPVSSFRPWDLVGTGRQADGGGP